MPRTYTHEEVEEIFRRAALLSAERGEPTLTRQELLDAARAAGIEEDALHHAADEVETGEPRELSEDEAVAAWQARRRRRWWRHAAIWLVLSAGLLALNLLAGGAFWFQWPMVVLGIFVALHGVFALPAAAPEQVEKVRAQHRKKMQNAQKKRDAIARKLEAKRREEDKVRAKAARRERRAEVQSAFESAFETVVEEGVTALMDAAARALERPSRERAPRQETEFERFVARQKQAQRGERLAEERVRVDTSSASPHVDADAYEAGLHGEAAKRARR